MSITNTIANVADVVLDKVQTPTSRVGHVMERAAKLLQSGVDPDVVALQMTKNSPNGHVYTGSGVTEMANAAQDCQSGTILPANQTRALLNDQAQIGRRGDADDAGLAPQPA